MRYKYRRYFLYYLGRVFAFLVYLLPISIGVGIAAFLGRCAYLILPKYRNIAIANLETAFGSEKSEREIKTIAREVFVNLAKSACEVINFPKINEKNIDRFISIEGIEHVDRSFAAGKGTIVLASHFGNWELLGMTFRVKGYPGVTIGRKIYFYKYDNFLNDLRKSHDVNVIYRDDSPRKMLKTLKDNKILGIVADQDVDSVDGVFVNFFGKPAYTPSGPAALARASGAEMIPCFVIRRGRGHVLKIEEPVKLVDTGDRAADLVTNTQRWSDVIESYIKKYPEHWVWMHKRWKTKKSNLA
ncbi:MAG: lysophospholipid acyltransferase family protein [Candidatus Omnitrophota bacterium]|nr:lysophospholipid acyltransferase family protein [Candidatus Omnitrophota bacterium]